MSNIKIEYRLLSTTECRVSLYSNAYTKNEYGIYISKNEIIKNYENDKELFIDKLDNLSDMLTIIYGFNTTYWYKNDNFKNGYDYNKIDYMITIMRKSTSKGLLLYVDVNEDEKHFVAKIVKKDNQF